MAAVIDQPAPDFTLPDLAGRPHSLSRRRGQIVVLNFWSAECPWSRRADEFCVSHVQDWKPDDVTLLAIASNENETEAEIRAQIEARHLNYPLVLDAASRVADLYQAETTPHLFVIDRAGVLRYRGALDDVTFRKRQPTTNYLERAITSVVTGEAPDPAETPACGCTIVRARE